MDKKVIVGDKEYTVKEIKYKDVAGLTELSQAESIKAIVLAATGLTEEEYNDLSLKDGMKVQTVINEVNNLEDFQKPLTE